MPKISVIVPCYNQAQYLSEALESVLAQTYTNWECIIVNDGSPDNTEEVAMTWCEKDVRIKYFKKENGGLSSARNFGIVNSTGEYILPLDADDKIGDKYLELAIGQFIKVPDTTLVYCHAKFFGTKNELWPIRKYDYKELFFWNLIFCSAIFKRSDYNKTKGYNENMIYGFEDWDFWLSLLDESSNVYCLPDVLFFYRIKPSSRNNFLSIEKKLKDTYNQIYKNHLDLYLTQFYNPITLHHEKIEADRKAEYYFSEFKKIKNSLPFKLGKFIISPFVFIKQRLRF